MFKLFTQCHDMASWTHLLIQALQPNAGVKVSKTVRGEALRKLKVKKRKLKTVAICFNTSAINTARPKPAGCQPCGRSILEFSA